MKKKKRERERNTVTDKVIREQGREKECKRERENMCQMSMTVEFHGEIMRILSK